VEYTFRCSVCGNPLIAGRCLSCDIRRWSRFVHRELVLLTILVGVSGAAFVGTRAVARRNEALRRRQGAEWFGAAQRASRDGSTDTAVARLRRAVSKDPGNKQYRLALADGLAANGLIDEARRVLLALREAEPEDPDTNLQLARLEARGPDTDAARRYYQTGLAGLWRPDQIVERRRVRMELIELLLAREERARALSELLELAANLPQDAATQMQVGRMFMAAADPARALDHFADALRLSPDNAQALVGAGAAAFALGDYNRALRYLKAVPRNNAQADDLREVAELVLNADPLAPRLSASERRRRLLTAFQQAVRRLEACLGRSSVEMDARLESLRHEAQEFQSLLALPRGRQPPELIDDGADLVHRIERAAEGRCGTPTEPFDRALLLIGRRHGLEEQ
jgi:tetratricopeptide (TPR) repeat protein